MIVTVVLTVLLIAQALFLGGAKVLRLAPMQERAAHVGFTADAYARIGVLELLAAAGLGIGLVVPLVGILAASGLLVLLVGACVAHVRAGDSPAELVPAGIVAVLTVAYLVTLILTR